MHVLLVQCYTTDKPWGDMMIKSFIANVQRSATSAQFDICKVEEGESLPDASGYDLVIYTGGTFNLVDDKPLPWVEGCMDHIRDVSSKEQGPKILGFCWGHQAIQYARGGSLKSLDGARVGVESIPLTPAGRDFFRDDADLQLHKFHRRAVEAPAAGFNPLAPHNEILMSQDGQILSFQAHPELYHEMSANLVRHASSYTDADPTVELQGIDAYHDGERVWDRIMMWAVERKGSK